MPGEEMVIPGLANCPSRLNRITFSAYFKAFSPIDVFTHNMRICFKVIRKFRCHWSLRPNPAVGLEITPRFLVTPLRGEPI
jgi:hypothetical protein